MMRSASRLRGEAKIIYPQLNSCFVHTLKGEILVSLLPKI